MKQLVIVIFRPIYDTGLAGLGGVIVLSLILEFIKRFITGTMFLLSSVPSMLIPIVVFILALLFLHSSSGYKPSEAELTAAKKQGIVWGLVLAVFFYVCSNAFNNVAWDNLANASAETGTMVMRAWQTDLLILSLVTFIFGYMLGRFSYKLRQSVHNMNNR